MKRYRFNACLLLTFALVLSRLVAHAQHEDLTGAPVLWKGAHNQAQDTSSLLNAFKKGQVHGHFRYFFMATDNQAGLSDYYANAIGGGIKYETAPFKGFQLGVSGFFVFNIGSSDLSKPDPKTGQMNRYELALFDVEDPHNKHDIDRLEELYLRYNWKESHITFGKQLINTPFINLQDSRMRPTEVGGVYAEIRDIKNTKLEGGYLYEVSPRSTVKWYKVEQSIGVYSQGVNPDGSKAAYHDHLKSRGIAMVGITRQLSKSVSLKAWDLLVENILNSVLLQADAIYPLKAGNKLTAGFQYIRQDAVNSGGNDDPGFAYVPRGSHSQTFGASLGWENDHWQVSLGYNRITANGRYLMPREWGRDPFYTYLSRERNEGLADVHALALQAGHSFRKANIKVHGAVGYYDLPEVTDYAKNKYGVPSYTHFVMDVQHEFSGLLKGLDVKLLCVYKGKTGDTYHNDAYVINKVNTDLWSIIVNYHF